MTSAEYLSTLEPSQPERGRFLGLHLHFDPYSATAEEDYSRLREQIEQFDILGLLRSELSKGRVHTGLTRRLISALSYLDDIPRQQAMISLFDNIDTLAPVAPQVMLALRASTDQIGDDDFTSQMHSRVRSLVYESHYISKIDLNLNFMIRALAGHRSQDNEQLLIRLFSEAHGFGSGVAPTIQRDIMLILTRWRANYWLSDQKNYISTAHPWVKRAFLVASYALGDEGRHWRKANRSASGSLDRIVRDWVALRFNDQTWEVPI